MTPQNLRSVSRQLYAEPVASTFADCKPMVRPSNTFGQYERVTDARFTISKEFTGHTKARYVIRFCGDWVRSFTSKRNAVAGRIAAIRNRRASLSS